MAETLGERLTIRDPLGPPAAELRRERERLCAFLREREDEVFTAPDLGLRQELRLLLGWDDDTFTAFVASPLLTHSSPHTGLNLFAPMMSFAWVQRSLQEISTPYLASGRAVHLRTLVMHNNLGDLRYRPYAWWRRERGGRLAKTVFFSRGHAQRRKVLLALPAPEVDPAGCCESDRAAVALARHGRGYAYFALLYRRHIERQAGFHLPGASLDVPLNLLAGFTFRRHDPAAWAAASEAVAGRSLRAVSPEGELTRLSAQDLSAWAGGCPELERLRVVMPNFAAFAQIYRLGVSVLVGAEKMARYVAPMNAEIAALLAAVGESAPAPRLIPITRFPVSEAAPLDEPTRAELGRAGLTHSLPLAVADFGAGLSERFAVLLDRSYREFFPVEELATEPACTSSSAC